MRSLLAVGVLSFVASVASAGDWAEFRGPTGQGHADGTKLPIEWSAEKNVAWKTAIPGKGWSSPIVVGNRIFLTAAVPSTDEGSTDQSLRAICLDAASGKTEWDKEIFVQDGKTAKPIHGKNSHASSTPISDGKHVYVHFGTHGTACLTLDGNVVWQTRELKYEPRHGNGSSPIFVDDMLIVCCDGADVGFVVAFDKATGEVRWRTKREHEKGAKFSFATPLLIEVNGEKQIVSPATFHVIAYRPKDGTEIWRCDYGDGYSVIPRPVFGHGLVFIGSGYDSPSLLAIRPDGKGNVTKTHVAWTISKSMPHTPSPLLVGDNLYVVSDGGIATCLDAESGKEVWQKRLGGGFSASPTLANGKIYFQSEQGETTVIEPANKFQEVARNQLEPRTFASYAVADGAFFIRTETQLYRIQEK